MAAAHSENAKRGAVKASRMGDVGATLTYKCARDSIGKPAGARATGAHNPATEQRR